MIKNILFDFGWVMISVKKSPVSIIEKQYWMAQWDIMKKIKVACIIPFAEWKITASWFKVSLIDVMWDDIWNSLFNSWNDRALALLNKEMLSLVNDLSSKWYNCCLLSDTNEIHKEWNIKKWWYDVFDNNKRILSCEIWVSKVSDWLFNTTKFFDYALDKLNILPEESIFIDDLQINCDVANKVWIKTILAEAPKQVIQDLSGILGLD